MLRPKFLIPLVTLAVSELRVKGRFCAYAISIRILCTGLNVYFIRGSRVGVGVAGGSDPPPP